LLRPEVAVEESGWLGRVAQEEREEEVQEMRWKRKVEVQRTDLQRWEHPGIRAQVVRAEVQLVLQSLFLVGGVQV